MCTLTWWQEHERYGVLFNRDESVKRGRARPPVVFTDETSRSIRPIDPDGGGTWIWVNERGMIACVLNNYTSFAHVPHNPVSRGLMLTSLVSLSSVSALEQQMSTLDCSRYRGFFLFGYDGTTAVLFSWDGRLLSRCASDDVSCPVTTSGFLPDEVIAYRRNQFRIQVTEQPHSNRINLETYHKTHNPEFPAQSVLMARPDARTVSHSQIIVDPTHIRFSYAAVDSDQYVDSAVLTTLEREN